MWRQIIARAKHWHAVFRRSVWRFLIAAPFAVLGALAFLRDEFLSQEMAATLKMPNWLPAIGWYWWVIMALAAIIVAILEGSYREYSDIAISSQYGRGTSGSLGEHTISSEFIYKGKKFSGIWYGNKFVLDYQIEVWRVHRDHPSNQDQLDIVEMGLCETNVLAQIGYHVWGDGGALSVKSFVDAHTRFILAGHGAFDVAIGDDKKFEVWVLRSNQPKPVETNASFTLMGWTRAGRIS